MTKSMRSILSSLVIFIMAFVFSACPSPVEVDKQLIAPLFSIPSGTYNTAAVVSISAQAGATIRYTIDGSIPTASTGTVYTTPVTITATATLTAVAFQSGWTASPATEALFEINQDAVPAPLFSLPGGVYFSERTVGISASPGSTIRYTLNGSTPTATTGTAYSAPLTIGSSTTLKAIAILDDRTSLVTEAFYEIRESTAEVQAGSYFWGTWLNLEVDESWRISDRSVSIDGDEATIISATEDEIQTASHTLGRESDNVIVVQEGARSYRLLRDRGTGTITGTVVRQDSDASALSRNLGGGLSGIGGIKVVIANVNNPANRAELTTAVDGSWTFDEAIPGETYAVEPEALDDVAQVPVVTVIPREDGEDVGNITFTEAPYNFKVSAEIAAPYLYAGTTYPVTIRIRNTGTQSSLATMYHHAPESGMLVTPNLTTGSQTILGSILPGMERTVELEVRSEALAQPYVDKLIRITLTDTGGTWEDVVTLRFYRQEATVNIVSLEAPVNGVIIAPDNKATWFKTSGGGTSTLHSTSVKLPYHSGYLIAFSEASLSTETRYSFGIDRAASTRLRLLSFNNTLAFETNNSEAQAVEVATSDVIDSYLHITDYDYFVINTNKVAMPVFTTPGQEFAARTPVTTELNCATMGAQIYYTRDGSDPDPATAIPYTAGTIITVLGTETLKARAILAGYTDSAVAVEKYVFPATVQVTGYERLLIVDSYTTVTFAAEFEKWLACDIPSDGTYRFFMSNGHEGSGDTALVRATLFQSNGSTVQPGFSAIISAYTMPISANLTAGRYYLLLSSDGVSVTGTARVKIHP